MKKILFCAVTVVTLACSSPQKEKQVQILSDGIKFCESVIMNGDNLLVVNFGTQELNPLNVDGKGFVVQFHGSDTTSTVVIPADGTLSAPKGTAIKDNHLFIADVGKMVIYNLGDPTQKPQIIALPDGELFLNDIALSGNQLYVSVTNTGNIYSLDVTDPSQVDSSSLTIYTNIPGANGLFIDDKTMYVASYPADNVTKDENVIYVIDDIVAPTIVKMGVPAGQYDGIALSSDKSKLYFTNWISPELKYIDLKTNEIIAVDLGVDLAGPARLIISNGVIYLPDLPNSRVIKYNI